ncbi:MAG TPA: response regulator [Terriglobales bacterium]|nr:response regulator [Terriglobales bacterium]
MARERVLLVDDEPGVRATLSEILRQQGFDVVIAATVSEGLEAMSSGKFHALISDLNIGEPGDGFTLVSAMRRTQPNAVTIIITGYPAFDSALEAIRRQVDGYLIKPTKVPELVNLLRNKLGGEPGKHVPLPHKRLSEVLAEHNEHALNEWSDRIRSSPPWANLSLPELQDGLRVLVSELSWRVEHPALPIRAESIESARRHGQLRKSQGFKIPEVLSETRVLRQVILNVIHTNLM